eukprot:scaffold3405_cov222-Prasinococcus_capsulatus_cf.AAC.3
MAAANFVALVLRRCSDTREISRLKTCKEGWKWLSKPPTRGALVHICSSCFVCPRFALTEFAVLDGQDVPKPRTLYVTQLCSCVPLILSPVQRRQAMYRLFVLRASSASVNVCSFACSFDKFIATFKSYFVKQGRNVEL